MDPVPPIAAPFRVSYPSIFGGVKTRLALGIAAFGVYTFHFLTLERAAAIQS